MNTTTIDIEIPKDILLSLNENTDELTKKMKLYTALILFKEHKLTIGKAAEFSDLSLYNFMMEAGKHNIDIITYDENELENELEILDKC